MSFYELVGRVKLKFGELHAVALCHYRSFAEVVSQALGGGDGKNAGGRKLSDEENLANAPSYEAAIANMNQALTFG